MRNLILFSAFLAQIGAAQNDVIFHSGVSQVRVDAQTVDAAGAILPGLGRDDFLVFEDGRQQPVVHFSFGSEPLDLILLFDIAGSMRGKLLEVIRAIELGFQELRTGDRVCVMAFNQSVTELAPFDADTERVSRTIVLAVPRLRFGGGSNPALAADTAARRLRREPRTGRRRAILMITDRIPPRGPDEEAILNRLWESDAVLSELILGHRQQTRIMEHGTNGIVDGTGGEVVEAGDAGAAFEESVRGIRSRYTLYYDSPPAEHGSRHEIRVALSPGAAKRFPGARVRARTGYVQ